MLSTVSTSEFEERTYFALDFALQSQLSQV
jgi:hypothetical protein